MPSVNPPLAKSKAGNRRQVALRGRASFDECAKGDIRQLLAALREIGDRPDIAHLVQKYAVSEQRLKKFIESAETDALLAESFVSTE